MRYHRFCPDCEEKFDNYASLKIHMDKKTCRFKKPEERPYKRPEDGHEVSLGELPGAPTSWEKLLETIFWDLRPDEVRP
jgi:hypothetical protein